MLISLIIIPFIIYSYHISIYSFIFLTNSPLIYVLITLSNLLLHSFNFMLNSTQIILLLILLEFIHIYSLYLISYFYSLFLMHFIYLLRFLLNLIKLCIYFINPLLLLVTLIILLSPNLFARTINSLLLLYYIYNIILIYIYIWDVYIYCYLQI